MLINFEKHLKKLNDIRAGKVNEGLRLGVDRLDNNFRFVHGHLNFILGPANTGKTHLVFYLMFLYSLKHNVRWLVFSSENEPYSLIRKLIEFAEGKPINQIEKEDFKKQYDWVFNHFKFVDTEKAYTYKDLLELATAVKKAWDYQGFLSDPLNSLKKERDRLKLEKEIENIKKGSQPSSQSSRQFQQFQEQLQELKRNQRSTRGNNSSSEDSLSITEEEKAEN